MEFKMDLDAPLHETVASLEPSKLWLVGMTIGDVGSETTPVKRQDSFWSECECPGDCLRDHDRE